MKKLSTFVIAGAALVLTACVVESSETENNTQLESAYKGSDNGENGLPTSLLKGALRVSLLKNQTIVGALLNSPLKSTTLKPAVKNAICQAPGTTVASIDWDKVFNGITLKYIVQCALQSGQALDFACASGAKVHFDGVAGVAPNWANNKCATGGCQEKVSACVISMSNFKGEHVANDIAGVNGLNKVDPGNDDPREGAYWGNIFLATPEIRGCYAPGTLDFQYKTTTIDGVTGPAPLMRRTCGSFNLSNRLCLLNGEGNEGKSFLGNLVSGKVQACSSVCAEAADGDYTTCGNEKSPAVSTVRRRRTMVCPVNDTTNCQ